MHNLRSELVPCAWVLYLALKYTRHNHARVRSAHTDSGRAFLRYIATANRG